MAAFFCFFCIFILHIRNIVVPLHAENVEPVQKVHTFFW